MVGRTLEIHIHVLFLSLATWPTSSLVKDGVFIIIGPHPFLLKFLRLLVGRGPLHPLPWVTHQPVSRQKVKSFPAVKSGPGQSAWLRPVASKEAFEGFVAKPSVAQPSRLQALMWTQQATKALGVAWPHPVPEQLSQSSPLLPPSFTKKYPLLPEWAAHMRVRTCTHMSDTAMIGHPVCTHFLPVRNLLLCNRCSRTGLVLSRSATLFLLSQQLPTQWEKVFF